MHLHSAQCKHVPHQISYPRKEGIDIFLYLMVALFFMFGVGQLIKLIVNVEDLGYFFLSFLWQGLF